MPDIHIDAKLGADLAARDLLAATFGLAADAPAVVRTGCGREVPLAMTSTMPSSVGCAACRSFAHDEYLRVADQVESLARMPGSVISWSDASAAAARCRELASRFLS